VDICLAQILLSTNSSRALQGANLIRADLSGAKLSEAKLISANKLSEAKLDAAQLIRTDLRQAELTGSSIYGISAWDVKVDSGTQQRNLIITPKDEPASFGELRAGGGVDGVWGGKGFESSESGELNDDLFWLGQNRDGVRLEAGAEGLAGFELALEDEGWEGEFLFWEAKEDSSWPAPGTCRAARKLPRSGWRRA
jgi:hypothetical protein